MSDTPVTRWDLVRGFFAKDKDAFWWDHFTSEEKKLARMDVWQLAKLIEELKVRNLAGTEHQIIVAQHLLAARLAKIQALPVYLSLFTAFAGVIVGAYLTAAFQPAQPQSKCVCEYQSASAAKNGVTTLEKPLVIVAPSKPAISVPTNVKEGAAVQNNGKPSEKN